MSISLSQTFLSAFISKKCFVHHHNIGEQIQNNQLVHEGSFILTLTTDLLWISTILLIKWIKSRMSGERPEIESNDYINLMFRMIHKTSHEYQVFNFYTSQIDRIKGMPCQLKRLQNFWKTHYMLNNIFWLNLHIRGPDSS